MIDTRIILGVQIIYNPPYMSNGNMISDLLDFVKEKYPMAGKYRDALLVYFTDGYGDYEIPKPKTYRNLWVVLHDVKNLSLKNPYGDVKSLSMDADYKKLKGIR